MATTKFKQTLDAIKSGVQEFTAEKGVKNIEGWEDYLGKHDKEGVKAVVADLGKLKKLLQSKELDGAAIKKLVIKVGKDTVKVAGEEQSADAKHIRELGEALTEAAQGAEETGASEDAATEEPKGTKVTSSTDESATAGKSDAQGTGKHKHKSAAEPYEHHGSESDKK